MNNYLIVEEVSGNDGVEIGRLGDLGEVGIGREPDEGGIVLDKTAISRVHGIFKRFKNHWFYQDNFSTNGSWINGSKIQGGHYKIIRTGDVLQLADGAIRFAKDPSSGSGRQGDLEGLSNVGGRSLIVFLKGDFVDEFPIPEYGRALSIGGSGADLELEGDLFDSPSLVIERRGASIIAYSIAQEASLLLNGVEIEGQQQIASGDEVELDSYSILFNDPMAGASAEGARVSSSDPNDGEQQAGGIRGWSSSDLPSSSGSAESTGFRSPFGQGGSENEGSLQTFAMDTNQIDDVVQNLQYGGARGTRTGAYDTSSSKEFSYSSLEDRIILLVIFFVLVALMILVAVFALG